MKNNPEKSPKKPSATSWGKVADWYDDLLENKEGTYQKDLILPNLLRIADVKKGQTILDLACGQGFFSRCLASAGASVVASDISKELVALAKLHSPASIQYHVSPAEKADFCQTASIDVVTIILSIQNIDDIQSVFRECARVLKPKGRLIFVLNHPAFRIPKRSSWGFDGTFQYRRLDAYMSDSREEIDMNPGKVDGDKKMTISFHRSMQVYFKALGKAGLAVTRLEEWVSNKVSKPGARAEEENRIRKEIPLFLTIEATKI